MNIFTATSASLPELWQHARPYIERFSAETLLISADDMYRDIALCEKQLWMAETEGLVKAVVVTQVYKTMRGDICCIWAACGDAGIKAMKDVLDQIEIWAMEMGCVALEIRGRKGWERALPAFRKTGVLLEKNLSVVH